MFFCVFSTWFCLSVRSSVVVFHDMFMKVSQNSAKICYLWNIATCFVGGITGLAYVSWHKSVIKTVVLCTSLSDQSSAGIWMWRPTEAQAFFEWNGNKILNFAPSILSFSNYVTKLKGWFYVLNFSMNPSWNYYLSEWSHLLISVSYVTTFQF